MEGDSFLVKGSQNGIRKKSSIFMLDIIKLGKKYEVLRIKCNILKNFLQTFKPCSKLVLNPFIYVC